MITNLIVLNSVEVNYTVRQKCGTDESLKRSQRESTINGIRPKFISFALSLTGELQVGGFIRLGLTIAIFLYLTKSVNRISAQGKIAGDA